MAIDIEALRNLGMSDADIAQIAAFDSGAWQTEENRINDLVSSRDAAALAAAKATGLSNIDMYANPIGAGDIIPGLSSNIMARLGMYNPEYQAVMRTYGSETDRNNPNDVTERSTFAVDPTASYRLVDNKTGQVISAASSPAEVAALVDRANAMSAASGKKADWSLQASTPVAAGDPNAPIKQGWNTVARDEPSKLMDGTLGAVMDVALPVLASAIVPGAGFLGTILPAAGASAASSALQDRSLKETAIRAAMAGAGAGLGEKFISPALNAFLNPVAQTASGALTQTAAQTLGQGAGDIVVRAIPQIVSGLSSAAGSALGNVASNLATSQPSAPVNQPTSPELVLTGNRLTTPFVSATTNLLNPARFLGGENVRNVQPEQTSDNTDTAKDELIVTAREPTGNLAYIPSLVDDAMQAEMAGKTTPPPKSAIEKINDIGDYVKLAGLGTTLIGGLFGGGGGGTSGVRYPGAGTGTLNPLYSAKLPAPNMPGAAGNFAVRPQTDFGVVNGQPRDWTKYGFGPEASFFNYVPQPGEARVATPMPAPTANPSSAPAMYIPDDMRFSQGGSFAAKHGGSSNRTEFAVSGPGTGRSDDIPAMLSDGEYVMDAETVALLGDGSPKAGAEALDRLRVNLRKHKGQKLAKGEFSVNAKQPERYLAGGRI
jgi:hypothetical protein